MTTRGQVVAEARTWIGTPFVHQGRLKGVGVDCVGVVIGVAHALGISDFDIVSYPMLPDSQMMGRILAEHLDPVSSKSLLPGDILWLRFMGEPQHVAIITGLSPLTVVHSFAGARTPRCLEQPLDGLWWRRVAGCYRYRGLE